MRLHWHRLQTKKDVKAGTAADTFQLQRKWESIWWQNQPKSRGKNGKKSGPWDTVWAPELCHMWSQSVLAPELSLKWPNMPLCAKAGWAGLHNFCKSYLFQMCTLAPQLHLTPSSHALEACTLWVYSFPDTLGHPCLSGLLPSFPRWNYTHPLRFSSNELSS